LVEQKQNIVIIVIKAGHPYSSDALPCYNAIIFVFLYCFDAIGDRRGVLHAETCSVNPSGLLVGEWASV